VIRRNGVLANIYLLALSSGVSKGEPRQATPDMQIGWFDWTPDGRSLVFTSYIQGRESLWNIAVSGGEPQPLVAGGENCGTISVSRQGNRLVYQQKMGDSNIWRIALPSFAGRGSIPKESSATRLIASTKIDWDPQFS